MPAASGVSRGLRLGASRAAVLAVSLAFLPGAILAQPASPPPEPEPPALVLEFNPWIGIRAISLGVERNGLTGDDVDTRPDVFLNVNIGGSGYGKVSGFFLAARLVPMNLNRQESFLAGEETADYGTSIRGFFLYAIPSYAFRPQPNMELFGGVGLGWVRVSGDIALCCPGSEPGENSFRKVGLNVNRIVFPAFHIGWRLGYFLAFASMMFFEDGANRIDAVDTGLFAVFALAIPL